MESHSIIAFAGHMIDQQDRRSPRFPAVVEPDVRASIAATIARLAPAAVITSAACGGDIICAEAALDYGAQLYVILPFADRDDFIRMSVANAGMEWVERFHAICRRATVAPYFARPGGYASDYDFEANQHALIFFALGVAAARQTRLTCLILCDEEQLGDQIGGTRSFLALCRSLQIDYEIINLAAIRTSGVCRLDPATTSTMVQVGGGAAYDDQPRRIT